MITPRHRPNAHVKQRSSVFAVATCTICGERLDTSNAFKGVTGQYWCSLHEKRGRLLDFAVKHHYPAISFVGAITHHYHYYGGIMRYTIGNNKASWEIRVFQGDDEFIEAALAYVEGVKQDEEETL